MSSLVIKTDTVSVMIKRGLTRLGDVALELGICAQ
jgi:hypothetical protein